MDARVGWRSRRPRWSGAWRAEATKTLKPKRRGAFDAARDAALPMLATAAATAALRAEHRRSTRLARRTLFTVAESVAWTAETLKIERAAAHAIRGEGCYHNNS